MNNIKLCAPLHFLSDSLRLPAGQAGLDLNAKYLLITIILLSSCNTNQPQQSEEEMQITFSPKNHSLDNNDNFSPEGKFLVYDTRGTVYNNDLANCKSIEKVEIATGIETVIWEPESITGEQAAPGVAAVSYHPFENKVAFIHGPFLNEVNQIGYYSKRNRTGVEVSADGEGVLFKLDMRDLNNDPTTPGAHRGGTHRHEYSRNGKRIGFTYDDHLLQDYDRTIGYMEPNKNAPKDYTHYFSLLVKPVKKGTSKPSEIEKAHSDSWVDSAGTMRSFIGVVRAENGIDYESSLFVAEIPDEVDITTAGAGDVENYPTPAQGIIIRRLTHSNNADGIVRGSFDGKTIAYFDEDSTRVKQVFTIPIDGSDQSQDADKQPRQLTSFQSNASAIRWHPSDRYILAITDGNVVVINVDSGNVDFITNDNKSRSNLVVSPDGKTIAYNIRVEHKDAQKSFSQIFVKSIDLQ
ncbi:MAG: DUF3748 domain-containing protein [Bacteroidota bacterium]